MIKIFKQFVMVFFIAGISAQSMADSGNIDADTLMQRLQSSTPPLVIDVRTSAEYDSGHVPGAINIPHYEMGRYIERLAERKGEDIILYCVSGMRASIAADLLNQSGFANLIHLDGDMPGWEKSGKPVEK